MKRSRMWHGVVLRGIDADRKVWCRCLANPRCGGRHRSSGSCSVSRRSDSSLVNDTVLRAGLPINHNMLNKLAHQNSVYSCTYLCGKLALRPALFSQLLLKRGFRLIIRHDVRYKGLSISLCRESENKEVNLFFCQRDRTESLDQLVNMLVPLSLRHIYRSKKKPHRALSADTEKRKDKRIEKNRNYRTIVPACNLAIVRAKTLS